MRSVRESRISPVRRTGDMRSKSKNASVSKLREARRIIMIGAGGSGKSTLASHLGKLLNLEVIHLDQHYWSVGWKETPREEWEKIVWRLTERESWVMETTVVRWMRGSPWRML